MKVNRVDFLRGLKLAKSMGISEVKFDEQGNFGVASSDGASLLFGKGLVLGCKLAILELEVLVKMLDSFSQAEVMLDVAEGVLKISGGEVRYGYRLANWDLVDGQEISKKADIDKDWQWNSGKLVYEDFVKIKKLISALGVAKVSFREDSGKMVVCVGDKAMYFGEIELKGIGLSIELSFEADKVNRMLEGLDSGTVVLSFATKEMHDDKLNQTYAEGILRVTCGDFTWYIGSLKPEQNK